MSASLHLDLLKEEERFSSSPVRLRVLVPVLAISAATACLLWCAYLSVGLRNQSAMKTRLQGMIGELQGPHTNFLSLVKEEREASSIIRQLRYYERSRLRVGAVLAELPEFVPAKIQLAEIRITAPPPVQADSKNPDSAATNTTEMVSMKIAGRAFGDDASGLVDALLETLRAPRFATTFQHVEVPKGAFRQDFGYTGGNRKAFLFEIDCAFHPRRFE